LKFLKETPAEKAEKKAQRKAARKAERMKEKAERKAERRSALESKAAEMESKAAQAAEVTRKAMEAEEEGTPAVLSSNQLDPKAYPSVHVKLKTASSELLPTVVKKSGGTKMIEVVLNDRLGKKIRVKCNSTDTVGTLKKLAAAHLGTRHEKLRIQKWYNIYKDHIQLEDYEIHDGMGLELYYM